MIDPATDADSITLTRKYSILYKYMCREPSCVEAVLRRSGWPASARNNPEAIEAQALIIVALMQASNMTLVDFLEGRPFPLA